MARQTLSVTVITRNEERRLRACLESVAWADELVVVDSESTDATCEIAREYTPNVFVQPWLGFGPQKNVAIDRASADWVLSLDADERVTPALAEAIRTALDSGRYDAWWLRRRSSYCGRYMRFGDWARDRVLRLFRRGRGRFSDHAVHERVEIEGPAGRLRPHLMHDTFQTHGEMLEKINRYSGLWAEEAFAGGRRCSFASALGHGGWAFVRTGLLRGGLLDGRQGMSLSIATAEGAYYRYLKLHQMGVDAGNGQRGPRDDG